MQTGTGTPKAPTTRAELEALNSRRIELTNQLESLSDRSGELIRERGDAAATNNQAMVTNLDGRLKELTERVTRIEREKLATDDLIADALARGVGTSDGDPTVIVNRPSPDVIHIPEINIPGPFPGPRESNREEILLGFSAVLLTAIIVWRLARRSVEKRLKTLGFGAGGASGSTDAKDLKFAIESIAVEVERISENQRFVTALLSERQGIALPSELEKEPAPLKKT